MNGSPLPSHTRKLLTLPALILASAGLLFPGISQAQGPPVTEVNPSADDILTRGPIHEAFASVTNLQPVAGLVINQAPPEAVNELPPNDRPEGDNVAWIPGYWMWDDEGDHFIWVSGIWRVLPPGRQWIPGYWGQVDAGWQWISGYWADTAEAEVTYLPEPPPTLESGPSSPAPSRKHTWQPGSWEYYETDWRWRPGFWLEQRPDWIWTPAHYVWTPRGCIYVPGYWDYVIVQRGVIFAPVRWQQPPVWHEHYWRPSVVVEVNVFFGDVFIRPRACHYYFGDYYEDRYRDRGYIEPYAYTVDRGGWDPIFYHERWSHRDDDQWTRRYVDGYHYRAAHVEARPPISWRDAQGWERRDEFTENKFVMARRYDDHIRSDDRGRDRFRPVAADEQKRYAQLRDQLRDYRGDRANEEIKNASRGSDKDKDKDRDQAHGSDSKGKDNRPQSDRIVRVQRPESPTVSREKSPVPVPIAVPLPTNANGREGGKPGNKDSIRPGLPSRPSGPVATPVRPSPGKGLGQNQEQDRDKTTGRSQSPIQPGGKPSSGSGVPAANAEPTSPLLKPGDGRRSGESSQKPGKDNENGGGKPSSYSGRTRPGSGGPTSSPSTGGIGDRSQDQPTPQGTPAGMDRGKPRDDTPPPAKPSSRDSRGDQTPSRTVTPAVRPLVPSRPSELRGNDNPPSRVTPLPAERPSPRPSVPSGESSKPRSSGTGGSSKQSSSDRPTPRPSTPSVEPLRPRPSGGGSGQASAPISRPPSVERPTPRPSAPSGESSRPRSSSGGGSGQTSTPSRYAPPSPHKDSPPSRPVPQAKPTPQRYSPPTRSGNDDSKGKDKKKD